MAEQETVKFIRTQKGDCPVDYTALANLPKSDTTLKKSGEFADAAVTGTRLGNLDTTVANLNKTSAKKSTTINGKTLENNITLESSDIGAAPEQHSHAASDINSGTLSMERGGTDANNGKDGLKNLLAAGHMILSEYQYGTNAQFEAMKEKNNALIGQVFFVKVQ